MKLAQPTRAEPRSQSGFIAVEFACVAMVLIVMIGWMLQVGRAVWYHNALVKATGNAALYLAQAPDAERLGSATATATNMVVAAAAGAGFNVAAEDVLILCSPSSGTPCVANGNPQRITVVVTHTLTDNLFPNITGDDIDQDPHSIITMRASTSMPRVGF